MFSKVSGKVEGQENGNEEDVRHAPREDAKGIALMEAKVQKLCLCDLLDDTFTRTKENVGEKQALTYEEMEAEREEER